MVQQHENDINSEFQQALSEFVETSGSSKMSAVVEALKETLKADSNAEMTVKMFQNVFTTLEGTVFAGSKMEDAEQLASLLQTQATLLQIAVMIMEFTENFKGSEVLSRDFPIMSRVLRAIHLSLLNNSSPGVKSTLRQLLITIKSVLLGVSLLPCSGDLQKNVAKLMQEGLLQHISNPQSGAKVRKVAQSALVELLQHCSTNHNSTSIAIQLHLQQYIHSMMFPSSKNKKLENSIAKLFREDEQVVQLLHLLQFVQGAGGTLLNLVGRKDATLKIDRDLVQLLTAVMKFYSQSDIKQKEITARVTQVTSHLLSALLSLIEYDPTDWLEEHRVNIDAESYLAKLRSMQQDISSHVVASLIQIGAQINVLLGHSLSEVADEQSAKVLYARLLTSGTCALVYDNQKDETTVTKFRLVGQKLYPVTLRSLVGLMSSGAAVQVHLCCDELQRLNRICLGQILPNDPSWLHEASVETSLRESMVKQLLSLKCRHYWNFILPTYASFVLGLHTNDAEGAYTMIKDMISELIQLYEINEQNDEASLPLIESAMATIIEGMGLQTFWHFVSLNSNEESSRSAGAKLGGIESNKLWLLHLMKNHGANADGNQICELAYFQSNILALARQCDIAASALQKTEDENVAVEVSQQRQACTDLFALLQVFCSCYPSDVAESFVKLCPTLIKAMQDKRYPHFTTTICTSLQTLVECLEQTKKELTTLMEHDKTQALEQRLAKIDLDLGVLTEASVKLLPQLFKRVEHLTESMTKDDEEVAQRIQSVTLAIGALAKHVPPATLGTLFQKLMHRLLSSIQQLQEQQDSNHLKDKDAMDQEGSEEDAIVAKICTLLRLAQALVISESLDASTQVDLMYRSIKPLIRSENSSTAQKQAYKTLSDICSHYTTHVLRSHTEDIVKLLTESLMSCHVSARNMRLKCLLSLVSSKHRSEDAEKTELPESLLGEVLLCLKDGNGKARENAYDLLLAMARRSMQENGGSFKQFVTQIVGALGAQTTHMRSAAVMALSRITFEFARHNDELRQELLPQLVPTVLLLLEDHKSREVVKSVVGFVRVSVAALSLNDGDLLEPLMPAIVEGLFKYGKGKDRFRAKIKIIIKKFVRLYGYEKITPHVPSNDSRLLTHMRKLSERSARRKAEERAERQASGEQQFDNMMESDEEDSDDGRTLMTGMTGFTRMTALTGKSVGTARSSRSDLKSVHTSGARTAMSGMSATQRSAAAPRLLNTEKDGEILDLNDSTAMQKSVRFEASTIMNGGQTGRKGDIASGSLGNRMYDDDDSYNSDDGMMEFDASGKLVIQDAVLMMEEHKKQQHDSDDEDDGDIIAENAQIKHGAKRPKNIPTKLEAVKQAKADAHAKKNEQHRQKKLKMKNDDPPGYGAAYKSKKASGDVKKKNQKFEPYAYIPLDGKSYSKKHRSTAVSQMSSVIRSGAGKKGSKNSGKRKR